MENKEKYIILIGDGMADYPVPSLGGMTPLEYAKTPNMDFIAKNGIAGLSRTVPEGMQPGSDTANLSIFGYDPRDHYTGRAPLEAINMGIDLDGSDAAFRVNTVKIKNGIMEDFSAGHIASEFSKILIDEISRDIRIDGIEFYPGVSYRNLMIWRGYPYDEITLSTPPHDIQGREVSGYLPSGRGSELLINIMKESKAVISSSGAVADARKKYRGDPESLWIWGGGKKPVMKSINEKFGLKGCTISAVDLIHGIGKAAGMKSLHVDGATGYLDTNYEGKADVLVSGLDAADLVVLHVESPDESGHEGNLEHKIKAIEDFDSRVVGRVLKGVAGRWSCTILVMPDHPTPLSLRTHSGEPVPFAIYKTDGWEGVLKKRPAAAFSEKAARETGAFIEGHRLLEFMINGDSSLIKEVF